MPETCNGSLPNIVLSDFRSDSSYLVKPRQPLNFGPFNLHILLQDSQQACLPLAMDSLASNIWRISTTRIQDSSGLTQMALHGFSLGYFLRTLEKETAPAASQRDAELVLTDKTEYLSF